jgi:hypothetical protein
VLDEAHVMANVQTKVKGGGMFLVWKMLKCDKRSSFFKDKMMR